MCLCGVAALTSVPHIWALLLLVAGSIEPTGLAVVKNVFWTGMVAWLVLELVWTWGRGPWDPVCVLTSLSLLSAGRTLT